MSRSAVVLLALVAGCFLLGCEQPVATSSLDDLEFTGLDKSTDVNYDAVLDMDPDVGYVVVGESNTVLVPLSNTGSAPLVVTDAIVYRQIWTTDSSGNRAISGTEENQKIFTFAGGVKLDYPITVAVGATFNGLYVTFSPETCGAETGVVVIKTEVGTRYVQLNATGAWKLTLSVNASQEGKITSPVAIASGASAVYYTTSSTVDVVAQTTSTLGLSSLLQWTLVSGTATIADSISLSTTVTLQSHAAVRADFTQPFYYVDAAATGSNDGTTKENAWTSLSTAVTWFNEKIPDTGRTSSTRKGIVVAKGTYSVSSDMTLIKGELKGGYSSGFTARAYESAADRTSSTYATVISLGSSIQILDRSSMDANSFLEGFTISGGTDSSASSEYAALKLSAGSTMKVLYNTVTGPSQGYAVFVSGSTPSISNCILSVGAQTNDAVCVRVDDSSPSITSCTISSGTGGQRSVGVFLYKNSSPTLTGNTITSGNPAATGASSMGLYIDANYTTAAPTISGNTIQPGTSSGSGCSSYGIYAINQAKKMAITGNTISGGYGAVTAAAMYFNYNSGYATVTGNTIYTDGGGSRYGMYLSRGVSVGGFKSPGSVKLNVFRKDTCPAGYVYYFLRGVGTDVTDIDEVNELFFNDQDISTSTELNTEE